MAKTCDRCVGMFAGVVLCDEHANVALTVAEARLDEQMEYVGCEPSVMQHGGDLPIKCNRCERIAELNCEIAALKGERDEKG